MAWDRGVSRALPKLVELLTRRRKFDQLIALRQKASPVEARSALGVGDLSRRRRQDRRAVRPESGHGGWERPGNPSMAGRDARIHGQIRSGRGRPPGDCRARADSGRPLVRADPGPDLAWECHPGRETIEQARSRIKTDNPTWLEARLRWAASDRPAADRAFEAALAERRDDVPLLLDASSYFEATGRKAETLVCLKSAVRLQPGDREAVRRLALLLSTEPATWNEAVRLIGLEPSSADLPDDRLTRALVFSMAPEPARKAQAIGWFQALLDDLATEAPTSILARKG